MVHTTRNYVQPAPKVLLRYVNGNNSGPALPCPCPPNLGRREMPGGNARLVAERKRARGGHGAVAGGGGERTTEEFYTSCISKVD